MELSVLKPGEFLANCDSWSLCPQLPSLQTCQPCWGLSVLKPRMVCKGGDTFFPFYSPLPFPTRAFIFPLVTDTIVRYPLWPWP